MITVQIIGGVGNQMFQYAAARALTLRKNLKLGIDRSAFSYYKVHDYLLDHFAMDLNYVKPMTRFERKIQRYPFAWKRKYVEKGHLFDPKVLSLPDGSVLEGYWQSEDYFLDAADVIRRDFTIKAPPSPASAALAEAANVHNSVSLHVRRGDYISNPDAFAVHGTCSPDYYRQALEMLHAELGSTKLRVIVFSDDMAWARENLRFDEDIVWANDPDVRQPLGDMRAMSACRHHIVANSSFSWWGAWLTLRKEKILIAPRRWFRDMETDIVPRHWRKI